MTGIAVVTCVWQRPERLRYTLDRLAAQTMPCDVLMINNNAELVEFVDEAVKDAHGVHVWHNAENRNSQARTEVMHECSAEYDWFLTLDDDVNFGPRWAQEWAAQCETGVMKGWRGFRFVGNYWQREVAQPGEHCHYLFGSNLLVPSEVVSDAGCLDIPAAWHGHGDDLWLCYFANHVKGLRLKPGWADVHIEIDGKDTYTTVIKEKEGFLEELRARGWAV